MTTPNIELVCTQEQFEGIHEELDKVRSNSKTVKVDKQALTNLLIDHSTLLKEIKC